MQNIKKIYRNTYAGEEILAQAVFRNGQWEYESEFVPKSISNNQFGKQAIVIGNGTDRAGFDLAHLKKKKLQTYGCNALYRDFAPDFLVAVGSGIVDEIQQSGYCDTHVVLANTTEILKYPGKFHLIPQDPNWNAGALAAYLACFDGHAQIYLVGFDGNDTPMFNNNVYAGTNGYDDIRFDQKDLFWSLAMVQVFKTYPLVDFVLVNSSGKGYMPDVWKPITNLRRISFRNFVLECDL